MKSTWFAVEPTEVASSGGSTLTILDDKTVLSSGKNPDKDTYTVTLPTDEKAITGLRLAALQHSSFNGGLSRNNGNFVLTGVEVAVLGKDGKRKKVVLARAEADYSQPGFAVASLLAKGGTGWAIEGHVRKDTDRQAVFVFDKPITGTMIEVRLVHASPFAGHNIGRFRLDLTTAPAPGLGDKGGLPPGIVAALQVPAGKRTAAHDAALTAHYSTLSPELATTRAKVAKIEARLKQIADSAPQTLISSAAGPRMMRVLARGNWLDDTGEIVAPGVPASLPRLTIAGKRATRLDLAKWLVSPEHPLTARVFVNRLCSRRSAPAGSA